MRGMTKRIDENCRYKVRDESTQTGVGVMQTEEWKRQYEKYRDKLTCWTDLEAYFTNEEVGNTAVDTMDIGTVNSPTGRYWHVTR